MKMKKRRFQYNLIENEIENNKEIMENKEKEEDENIINNMEKNAKVILKKKRKNRRLIKMKIFQIKV